MSFETSTLCICSLCIMKWSWDQIVTDISAKFMSHWVTFEIMQYECNPGVWIMQLVHNKIYSNIYVCVWLGHFWDNAIWEIHWLDVWIPQCALYERFTDCILGSLNVLLHVSSHISRCWHCSFTNLTTSSYIVSNFLPYIIYIPRVRGRFKKVFLPNCFNCPSSSILTMFEHNPVCSVDCFCRRL